MSSPSKFDGKAAWPSRAQLHLVGLALVLGLFGIAVRLLYHLKMEQTSLLFIGIPTALAIGLTLLPRSENIFVAVLKGTTIALAMSGAVLGEGVVCVLVAAPIFYAAGMFVALLLHLDRRRSNRKMLSALLMPLVAMSFEGVTEELSFPRTERVSVERWVSRSESEIAESLAFPNPPPKALPLFLRLGFPRPQWIQGSGLEVGDRRVVLFAGGEGEPGELTLEIVERREGVLVFRVVDDQSKIAHWLAWREAIVQWSPADDGTRVQWTLAYERRLDPAWYFGPLERYAVQLAARVLIDQLESRP